MTQPIDAGRRRILRLLAASAAGAGWLPAARAASDTVVVLTSYPEELSSRFARAFEAAHPGARVEILWRRSADALAYLRSSGAAQVDVYWSPAPRNFRLLKAEGRFARLPDPPADLPGRIASTPISDPDQAFAAFELAGYGIAYHRGRVAELGLPAPRDWADLGAPAYRGQVQLPIPARVGFAPVLIEAILQGQGWDAGWATLAAIAANARFDRSDATPQADDLGDGRIAARLSIDFFAAQARATNPQVGFVYPPRTVFNPAHVAIFADAPHPQAAARFVDFVLSREGQALLLDPDVNRLPVRRSLYEDHPALSARPFADDGMTYDDGLTRARQGLVAAVFEHSLVREHPRSVALWQALHRAEADPVAPRERVGRARALLSTPAVSQADQADATLRGIFQDPDLRPGQATPPPGPRRLAIEDAWQQALAARRREADELLADWRP